MSAGTDGTADGEAAERRGGAVTQLLRHLQRHATLARSKTSEQGNLPTDTTLLTQLAGKLGTINRASRRIH